MDIEGRKHTLCRVEDGEAAMYEALAKVIREADDPGRMPDALARFKLEHLAGLSPSTRVEHRRIYDIFIEQFQDFTVTEVRPTDISRLLKLKWPDKLTMRRHAKSRLSTFFSWCVESGLRDDNPCRDLKLKEPPPHKVKWTDESFHRVRDALLPTPDEKQWHRRDGRLRDDVRAGLMMQCYLDLSFLLYQRATDVGGSYAGRRFVKA